MTKACPQCGTAISGWHVRLFGKDRAVEQELVANRRIFKITWGPFACTTCGTQLVLTCEDLKLVPKLAGAAFASIVAGFVFGFVIGWGGCFVCDLFLIGLLIALSGTWIVVRSIKVDVIKNAVVFAGGMVP